MDVFQKFIIETDIEEGDCIILAKCTFHKQLATDIKKVKGGGWWTLDRDKSIFTLYGDSHDFGRATIEDIANCVQRKKVYSSKSLIRNITENFKFQYKNEVGEIIDLETYGIVSEIEYCKCAHTNMINALEGLDINCYACHKEVEGMRNGINPKEWEEWEKGRFSKKNNTQY